MIDVFHSEVEWVSKIPSLDTRLNLEPDRVGLERNRISSEPNRISSEPNRISSEHDRISSEPHRISLEHDRVSSEHERISSEPNRVGRRIAGLKCRIIRIIGFKFWKIWSANFTRFTGVQNRPIFHMFNIRNF